MNYNFIIHSKKRKLDYHFARNMAVNESNIALERGKKKRKHKIFHEMTKK
jgi:hypothetical protein